MGIRRLIFLVLGAMFLIACSTSPDAAPAEPADSPRPTARTASQESAGSAPTPATPIPTLPPVTSLENAAPAPTPDSPGGAVPTALPTTVAPTTAAEVAAAPVLRDPSITPGGRLVRLYSDPPTLDPHLTTDAGSGGIIVEVFGGLVTIDPDLNIVPDLAESWEVSPDGRTYTFHLRRDARFHDGKPVTAADVRWSLERASDPATQAPVAQQYLGDIVGVAARLEGIAQSIAGVKAIDDHTLALTIDAPKSYFLAKLTYPTGFVLDRDNVENAAGTWTDRPNGTGPFHLAEYELGEIIRLTRNEGYHLGPPYLDEVEFILSGGNRMIMYENDEIHVTGVGLADLERVKDPASTLNLELHRSPPDFSVFYIGMNVNEPPLDDPKVRQALNLAFDRQTIAATVYEGLVNPAKSIIPPGFPSYNPDLAGYEFDPERARQLLAESSYGDSLDSLPLITLSIPSGFGAALPLHLEVLLQEWANMGVRVEIQQTEYATFIQDLHQKRFQMYEFGWIADYPDPQNFLDILFHSKSENNHINYSNPQVDALLEQARVEPDQATRFQLYNRIEEMILADAPWVPTWNRGEGYALVKPNVKGYLLTPLVLPKLRYVYFSE